MAAATDEKQLILVPWAYFRIIDERPIRSKTGEGDMNWLGLSLLALGLWGVWGFLGKVASQHLPSQQVYLLAISGHLVVAGYLLSGGLGAVSWQLWGVGAALGAGLAMALGLLYSSRPWAGAPPPWWCPSPPSTRPSPWS